MKWYWFICWSLSLAGCGVVQQWPCLSSHNPSVVPINEQWEECFDSTPFEVIDTTSSPRKVSHSVYCLGKDRTKPPLVLLHELPGLTPETLQYANELSNSFTVYVPLLFGEKGRSSLISGYREVFFGDEWNGGDQLDSSTPIVAWLQQVIHEIEVTHDPRQGIRIIGNCLTGILPLIAFDNRHDNRRKLLVLAQPSLPLKMFSWYSQNDKSSLGVTEDELKRAKNRPNQKIFWVRFQTDCISWADKQDTVFAHFKSQLIDRTICANEYDAPAHSVLIGELSSEQDRNKTIAKGRREEVTSFLEDPQKVWLPNAHCLTR